jgi:hypothetical protein
MIPRILLYSAMVLYEMCFRVARDKQGGDLDNLRQLERMLLWYVYGNGHRDWAVIGVWGVRGPGAQWTHLLCEEGYE